MQLLTKEALSSGSTVIMSILKMGLHTWTEVVDFPYTVSYRSVRKLTVSRKTFFQMRYLVTVFVLFFSNYQELDCEGCPIP